jgi:hypothetical protein
VQNTIVCVNEEDSTHILVSNNEINVVNGAFNELGNRDIKIVGSSTRSTHVLDSDKELNDVNDTLNELHKRNNCIPESTANWSQGVKGHNLFSPHVFEGRRVPRKLLNLLMRLITCLQGKSFQLRV